MWSYLLISLMLVAGLQAGDEASSEDKKDIADVLSESAIKFFEQRCLKNLNINLDDEDIELNTGEKPGAGDGDQSFSQTFKNLCEELRPEIYSGLLNMTNFVGRCLNPEESYLPHLFLGSFNATVDHYCEDGALSLLIEVIEVIDAEENCGMEIETLGAAVVDTCLPKLQFSQDFEKADFVLTRSYFCSEVAAERQCAIDVVKEKCKNSAQILELGQGLFQPLVRWCKEASENEVV